MAARVCLCGTQRESQKAYKEYGIIVESMYLIIVGLEINQVLRSVALVRCVLHMNNFCI